MNQASNFTIYRSSAGSGKTYTLVKEYIIIALNVESERFNPNYFKHILAITFTNKAATEMKSRVFDFLTDLKNGVGEQETESFFQHIIQETNLSSEEIKHRSSQILKAILHNYYNFSISTIDKFVYRLVRTFAFDLNLTQNFEVELETKNMIQQSVASLIEKIGRDKNISKALLEFSFSKMDDGSSYNIEKNLEDFSSFLFSEQSEKFLYKLSNVTINDCLSIRNDLRKDIHSFEERLESFSNKFLTFCKEKNLNAKSFYRGGFHNFFVNLKKLDLKRIFPSKQLVESIELQRWYSKTTDDSVKQIIDRNTSLLNEMYNEVLLFLDTNFKDYIFNKSFIKNIYSIAVYNELYKELNSYKNDQNTRHISEFNSAISNVVRKEPIPFIYERLGEKYFHFLIDEFQDTSVKQWHNLIPLINNSLSLGKRNLIVGDAKQSIYRWRGGEVEQFVQLPSTIFQSHLLPNPEELTQSISRSSEEVFLQYNWRSSYEIVDFNNRFFDKLKKLISEDYKTIYKNHSQIPKGKKDGYIHIDFTSEDKNSNDSPKEIIIDKIFLRIQELISQNYEYRDIAILCRTKNDALLVAKKLSDTNIPIVSDEALLLINSSEVRFLIYFLQFLINKDDKIAKTGLVNFLCCQQNLSNVHQYYESVNNEKLFLDFLNQHSNKLNLLFLSKLSLYDIIEKLISIFDLDSNNIYLQFFLDAVLKFSFNKANDVSSFLDWWYENNHKESIVISDDSNAVNVMTVHKSKGLEFPIVFLPFNWKIAKQNSEIWVDTQNKSAIDVALLSNNNLLEHSDYSDVRKVESNQALLDDINVLYVAMTRPKKQLYVFLEESKGDMNNYNTLSKLFTYYFNDKEVNFPFSEGKNHQNTKPKKIIYDTSYYLDFDRSKDWRKVVRLKDSTKKIWDIDYDKMEWGTQLHNWLSKIKYLSDFDSVLESLKNDKYIGVDLKEKLKLQLIKIFKNDKIKSYFDKDWIVKTETEILLKEGEIYIPDRVIMKKNQIVVIDYKTGSISSIEKHKVQLINYSNVLEQMGYSNIKLVLVYTEDNLNIVEL